MKLSLHRSALAALVATATLGLASEPALSSFPGANGKLLLSDNWVTVPSGGVARFEVPVEGAGDFMWSPDGSQLVFVADSGTREGGIFVADSDGTGGRLVIDRWDMEPFTEQNVEWWVFGDPSWAPSGDQILFTAYEGVESDIYIVGVDGSGVTRLPRPEGSEYGPVWSPDGSQIAFGSVVEGTQDIFLMDAEGNQIRNVTDSVGVEESDADWAPDGSRLVYSSIEWSTGNGSIMVSNADGSAPEAIAGYGTIPRWAPDGTKVAYLTRAGNARVIGIDGSDYDFTVGTGPGDSGFSNLAWQPCPVGGSCQEVPLLHSTKISLAQKLIWRGNPPTKPAIRASGAVKPARPGAVTVALQAKRNGRWKTTVSKQVTLQTDGGFKVVLTPSPAVSGVPCRVRARTDADANYGPGEKVVRTVAC